MEDNSDKKKIGVTYFFMRNPYMKFQNISIQGSKDMLCTRKCDERTDKSEAICPQLFQSWWHNETSMMPIMGGGE